ncbi:aspartic protease [Ophiostoma piceae UAMH 11346]|uniref:Aspartic protease n=1 Tax=Ophiostoma piceae (strain UAMH 11346) TaxID=1262450 RepID=S3CBQ1_OPHP1|nr:aspartic protease [Ophiostoma piceae UAMH 11346]
MRSMFSLLCLLGFVLGFAFAAPAPRPANTVENVEKRSFKVERFRNPNFTGRNSPKQLMKAHYKYGITPRAALVEHIKRQEIAAAAIQARAVVDTKNRRKGGKHHHNAGAAASTAAASTKTATAAAAGATSATNATNIAAAAAAVSSDGVGSVINTPTSDDVEYLSPVDIGGQTLNLDFDTGSSDLWVFDTQLSAKSSTGHTLFDSSKSSTFSALKGASFFVSYGDGSQVAGNVGTDTVNIGGATVTKQAVELATAVSQSFVNDASTDGLLGLAFSKLNTVQPTQQKTFFDNLSANLADPVFTADLRHNATGTYEFGAIDATKFTGDMTFVDVNTTQGFWQFSSSSFAVGTGAAQAGAANQAIADTGTTLMLVSNDIATAYYSQVDGAQDSQQAGGFTVPCDATLPDLQIDVGGSMATVKGSDIVFEEIAANTCFGGLQAIDSDLMIFGDIFFKSNFVAFNNGNNTLGFATHA